MKFRFPFKNVLKYRKILEDVAERDFQEMYSSLQAELAKLEALKQQIHIARRSGFETQLQGGVAGPALSQVHDFLTGQDVRIARQQQKVQEFEKRVEELREILRLKAIDYKMIESLKDRKLAEFKKLQNRKEQKIADDNSTMRFLAARAKIEEK